MLHAECWVGMKLGRRDEDTHDFNSWCSKLGTHFESWYTSPLFSRCSTVDPFRLNSAHHLYALAGSAGKGGCSHNVYRGRLHSRMFWVPSRLVIWDPKCSLYFLRVTWPSQQPPVWLWAGFQSGSDPESSLFLFQNEVQRIALSLGHDGMLAAFLELLFCLTRVEAAVTLQKKKHTCGKALHTLKPFQMAMSCWVGCLCAVLHSSCPWLRKSLRPALFSVGGAGSHQGPPCLRFSVLRRLTQKDSREENLSWVASFSANLPSTD